MSEERQKIEKYSHKYRLLGFKRMDLELITYEEYMKIYHKGGHFISPITNIGEKSSVSTILNDIKNKKNNIIKGNDGNNDIFYFFNRDNEQKNILSNFWEAGSNTVVFTINDKQNKNYVLKLQKFRKEDIEEYIALYQQHYERDFIYLLRDTCPKIYSCGKLQKPIDAVDDGTEIFYSIMNRYNSFFTNTLPKEVNVFDKSIEILYRIVYRLMKLHSLNYYLRDLKFENIGFTENYTPIFIDYDQYLCQPYSSERNVIVDTVFEGNTFYPYYFIQQYNNKINKDGTLNIEILNRTVGLYNHMEVMGLADIILILFFKPLISQDGVSNYLSAMYNGGLYRCDKDKKILDLVKIREGIYNLHLDKAENIKDIGKIEIFTDFLKPLYFSNNIETEFGKFIRKILFDKDKNKGLMHRDYNRIYDYNFLYSILILWYELKNQIDIEINRINTKIDIEMNRIDEQNEKKIDKKRITENETTVVSDTKMTNDSSIVHEKVINDENHQKITKKTKMSASLGENLINDENEENNSNGVNNTIKSASIGGKKYKILNINNIK